MKYIKRELLDPADEFCLKIFKAGLKNSEYVLSNGLPSKDYFDLDEAILGRSENMFETTEEFVKRLVQKVKELDGQHHFDRIAFIDKGGQGPVGLIFLAALIYMTVRKEALIIRPFKELHRSRVKGRPIRSGEKILILSDVATEGNTIFSAAQVIWDFGGKVPCALVFYDREQGAGENLMKKDIELISLRARETLKKNPEIAEKQYDAPKKIKELERPFVFPTLDLIEM